MIYVNVNVNVNVVIRVRKLSETGSNDDGDGKDNGKKYNVYVNKQQVCTCIRLFCTFVYRRCTTTA